MKLKKKLVALLTVLMMVVSIFGIGTAAFAAVAEGAAPTVSALKSGEQIAVSVTASEALPGFNGMDYTITYDTEAFDLIESDVTGTTGLDLEANAETGEVSISGTDGVDVAAGQTLSQVLLTPTNGYDKTKEYTFQIQVKVAYNDALDDYSWNTETFKALFQEEAGEAEEFVTFIDTAGNETKLYTGMIESCEKTANDNYLLKDVLTAAGITENLGDCRYKLTSNDGFTVYLDADEYEDNLALFYNKGWRSTLDDTTGYTGGWFKVKGLETITAENHNHVDGICNNGINISRDETAACGDEEEYVTFIDTAGNETKLTTSLIESCEKTANENYLLKDVLTAAGVSDNLGDCRYKLTSNDGFTVYIDADEFEDNLALFYNKGWRSTLDDTTGYEGGWFKVKGLETITAENHNHEDGICHNGINISRDETAECGDAEEVPILTGWQKVDGEWYYYENDGTLRADDWAKDSAGWCWLGEDGTITKNKWILDNGEWYYLKANGYMAANEWTKDSVGWMWMAGSGKITKNKWIQYKGEWYYLKANGYMAANEWTKDSVGWMWMAGSGKITKSKWIQDKGAWYYLKANGYMAANEWAEDSTNWYWMGANGKIASTQKK